MEYTWIVTKSFEHKIDCFCSGEPHTSKIPFQKGDRIELTDEVKNVEPMGWYVRIIMNQTYQVFVHIDDLEDFYEHHLIQSEMDLDLQRNYYQYKVNTALDEWNQDQFSHYVNKLEEVQDVLTTSFTRIPS
ncbi:MULTISPECIES: hypothetical protein [Pontibacillus]|uniref:IDEAL domain-containing protein n=1 Tax=Pontibacillus chungwhensis TaxID=265426 RepID=A0ABY8USM6_9BACI|nr:MULTISPECIES: hypothetical protein [Pontibacillus]MCD5323292.1 hypothetical protein [Pontibacillus sp. HN14]WIF96675.1 hypothetical protein QNI29_13045 [Pontibacillus chungwhensis]